MTRAARLAATLASLVLVLGVTPAPVFAQSTRYPPTPEDFDDEREAASGFWERVVNPDHARYLERIGRVVDLLKGWGPTNIELAEKKLREAITMVPDAPSAHWLLAVLYEHEELWKECVESYEQVAALEPGYQPPATHLTDKRGSAWALDYGLAICHAQLGDFERALAHDKRILLRGATVDARVYRNMGEAYMALGRVRDAIDTLEIAAKREPERSPMQWQVQYALAVAYDRDEQEANARDALTVALKSDPHITALEAPDMRYAPASDRYYYLGLAHEAKGQTEWATVYFRHYLHLEAKSPWARRTRDHLRDLGKSPLPHEDSVLVSDNTMDRATLMRAIDNARGDLHACLADNPGLLLEVRITALGSPPRHRPRPQRLAPAVKAKSLYSFATTEEQAARATACVEAVAEKIDIPQLSNGSAQYRTVTFPLIAPL